MTMTMRLFSIFLLVLANLDVAGGHRGTGGKFHFAIVGDGPYGKERETEFDNMIANVNADKEIDFVIHVGDIKSSTEFCSNRLLTRRYNQMQTFVAPFIFSPGDNDWTDCHRYTNGNYLPTERLAFLRRLFFPNPDIIVSGGQGGNNRSIGVLAQSSVMPDRFGSYAENIVFFRRRVAVATVHVVGSNNGLQPWDQLDSQDTMRNPRPDRIEEVQERTAASLAWLDYVFQKAKRRNSPGIFIAIHADPRFDVPEGDPGRLGFDDFLNKLFELTNQFGKPVFLAHGDSHVYFQDMPRLVPFSDNADATGPQDNFQVPYLSRVQTFGESENHWIKVEVSRKNSMVFSLAPQIVPANLRQ